MKLSKNFLILAAVIPLIFGVLILWNFISAINTLATVVPNGSTAKIYDQLILIGFLSFLALAIYWCVMVYLIDLLQENLFMLDENLDKAADIGAKHLTDSKNLLNQVIAILKRYETGQ